MIRIPSGESECCRWSFYISLLCIKLIIIFFLFLVYILLFVGRGCLFLSFFIYLIFLISWYISSSRHSSLDFLWRMLLSSPGVSQPFSTSFLVQYIAYFLGSFLPFLTRGVGSHECIIFPLGRLGLCLVAICELKLVLEIVLFAYCVSLLPPLIKSACCTRTELWQITAFPGVFIFMHG